VDSGDKDAGVDYLALIDAADKRADGSSRGYGLPLFVRAAASAHERELANRLARNANRQRRLRGEWLALIREAEEITVELERRGAVELPDLRLHVVQAQARSLLGGGDSKPFVVDAQYLCRLCRSPRQEWQAPNEKDCGACGGPIVPHITKQQLDDL
jgi:hypothetical protein